VSDDPAAAGPRSALAAARAFRLTAAPTSVARLGSGHIHDTYAVSCRNGDEPRAVLQRINSHVFPDPRLVVENVARIAAHLARRRPGAGRAVLRPLETLAGGPVHVDATGEIWRAFEFVPNALSFDTVDSPDRARAAARAFGRFTADLADYRDEIRDTLPGFHDFAARSRDFERAVTRDAVDRGSVAAPEIALLREARSRLERALPGDALDALPRRLVHNDCKINNVLFDAATGEAICVIDLDTVMRGTVLADFGDLVRTAASRSAEDAPDPEAARPDPTLYTALAEGYLEGAGAILTEAEIALLPLAGPLITLETALRFATDHLSGDTYFRVSRPGQNLDRARTQGHMALRLLEELGAAHERIRRAVLAASAEKGRS
jgi:Ser/Thr protein kinase RdoA (MazF antagonist)